MSDKKLLNVLLTCVASQIIPNVISLIKDFPDCNIRIIGIDSKPHDLCVGAYFCDTFYQAPNGNEDNYSSFILDLVEKEHIEIIFPGSDEEVLALSLIKPDLKQKFNCHVVSSDAENTSLATDKAAMLDHIKSNNIPTCGYHSPKDIEELVLAIHELGYPCHPVVIKPKNGRGSKGLKIIKSDINKYDKFMNNTAVYCDLNDITNFFDGFPEKISDFIAMEYLPGDKFSADILMQNGNYVFNVIRNNWAAPKLAPPRHSWPI